MLVNKAFFAVTLLSLSTFVAAQGTQFITGVCTSDADCASGCCGFNTGKCAGAIVALDRDGGCGFGDATSNDNAARVLRGQAPAAPAAPPPQNNAGAAPPAQNNAGAAAPPAAGSGKPAGTQFITGACGADADCASGCCGFNTGKCAGAIVALERDGGCGFGDATPNDDAARALRGQAPAAPPAQNNAGAAPPPQNNAGAAAPPAAGSGKPAGTQFITGACGSDADCASGCCGFNTGKCAGAIVALERDGGCGFGDATSNDNAARVLRGQAPAAPAAPPAQNNAGAAPPAQNNAGAAAPPAAPVGSGKPPGTQFITGPCANDGECAGGCCGFTSGKCAGAIIAQERDGGCGFGNATPNDDAAKRLRGRYVARELLYGY